MKNERGGIISKLFIIPAGVVLMLGFFFLGYYVGRHENKSGSTGGILPPLPEVVSQSLPKPEEFTFYKTLTEKDNKTVSIDLRPKTADTKGKAEEKQAADAPKETIQQTPKGKDGEGKAEKKSSQPEPGKQAVVKPSPATEKRTASAKQETSLKLRYTIQVSSHQERQTAEDEVKRMKQNGFAAYVVSSEIPGKGTWYRVRIGSFTKKEAAERLEKEVRAKTGVSPLVTLE